MAGDGAPGLLELPDVNVLTALVSATHEFHSIATRWFTAVTNFALTPVTETGLLRMLLNPSVTPHRPSTKRAVDVVRSVRSDPRARFVADDRSILEPIVELTLLAGHKQVTDFHLLDLARSIGAVLTTLDRRLARSVDPVDAAHVHTLA